MFVANAQQSFKSPEDAVGELVSATKNNWHKGVMSMLGKEGADIVSSGDRVADEAIREKFLAAYDAKHQVTMEGDDKAVVIIGPEDFPFPIPLMRKGAAWQFDTAAGRLEILYRRIGRNELSAIQASLAYVDTQNEYADKNRSGAGGAAYAQRIVSRPGKRRALLARNRRNIRVVRYDVFLNIANLENASAHDFEMSALCPQWAISTCARREVLSKSLRTLKSSSSDG